MSSVCHSLGLLLSVDVDGGTDLGALEASASTEGSDFIPGP